MRLGLIGYGNIARQLVGLLPTDLTPRLTILVRPQALEAVRAQALETGRSETIDFVTSRDALLVANLDLVVECAGQSAVAQHVEALLASGTDCLIVSVGALADAGLHGTLTRAAQLGRSRLILSGGAIGGLDLLATLSGVGTVQIDYRGAKPPAAWKGTPAASDLNLDNLNAPVTIFAGSARDAATRFPKNANVIAALALAASGFENVAVTLVADPAIEGNHHSYTVRASACTYSLEIKNNASEGNARTSAVTALSLLREVRSHAAAAAVRGRDGR